MYLMQKRGSTDSYPQKLPKHSFRDRMKWTDLPVVLEEGVSQELVPQPSHGLPVEEGLAIRTEVWPPEDLAFLGSGGTVAAVLIAEVVAAVGIAVCRRRGKDRGYCVWWMGENKQMRKLGEQNGRKIELAGLVYFIALIGNPD